MTATRLIQSTRDARGIALIAVLVALSILLGLAAPFLLSMNHGDDVARAAVSEKRADLASASARDFLLSQAAWSADVVDLDPLSDTLDEFPDRVEFPPGYESLTENGRVLIGGEVEDLQRRVNLNSATPLVIANLLGLGARLATDHPIDFEEITVDDAADFPPQGLLILDREVIQYESLEGNTFRELTRGLLAVEGFRPPREASRDDDRVFPSGTLLLDFRTVAATALQVFPDYTRYRPYNSVRELTRISMLAAAPFDAAEMDLLDSLCTVSSVRERATTWGRPARVFDIFPDELQRPRILRLKSAADLGGGSIVRIRSTDGQLEEYGMVWSTNVPPGATGRVNLPRSWFVELLTPLNQPFEPMNTTVERLVPVPVNINTARKEVLAAMFQSIRQRPRSILASGQQQTRRPLPYITRREAEEFADRITLIRTPQADTAGLVDPGDEPGAVTGWQDFERRFFRGLFRASSNQERTNLLVAVYDTMQVGRPGTVDMGTLAATFSSSAHVAYRAAALRANPLRGGEDARHERQGVALAAPETAVVFTADNQAQFEEYIRLDRRSPWWLTNPINTAALSPLDVGTEPSIRTFAHVVADAYPNLGLGQPRFPDDDTDEGSVKLAPSSTPHAWPDNIQSHERFSTAQHPEGRDLDQEGVYEIDNSGPRNQTGGGTNRQASHDRIQFPLTHNGGLTAKHAMQFWFRVDDASPQAIVDLSVSAEGNPNRNRISLQLRDQSLFFEVYDEAGLDPQPNAIDTVPTRPVGTWEVPLTEIDFQPDRWYHVNLSAMGNASSQIQLFIDGIPRLQPELRTYLTQQIAPFQFSNQVPNGQLQAQLQLPISVESTDGFPPRGVLKIGDELFEYTGINGNSFETTRVDSMGGRLARQRIAELNIPVPIAGVVSQQTLQEILNSNQQNFAPVHDIGAAVEFYGYALPVYPQRFLDVGQMSLTEQIGAFTVARVGNLRTDGAQPVLITVQDQSGQQQMIEIGVGVTPTFDDDLILVDPISADVNALASTQEVLEGFSVSGGYALLVQRPVNVRSNAETLPVGGITVIRYGSRNGDRLTNVQLAAQIPGVNLPATDFFDPSVSSQFLTDWAEERFVGMPEFDIWPNYYTYVVPISLPVAGNVPPPSQTVEWAQIYPSGNEIDTEWVRYNTVLDGRFLVRAELEAFRAVLNALANEFRRQDIQFDSGAGTNAPGNDPTMPWDVPVDNRPNEIGYLDPIEVQFPGIHQARVAFGFRGDFETGTSSHPHNSGDTVLPVHRFEFNWQENGALGARSGRNDRLGLVQGTARAAAQQPGVEWHTVNWVYRHYNADNADPTVQRPPERESLGPHPFQLVALKTPVTSAYLGGADEARTLLDDSRFLDRAVKFPSGELPAADVDFASIGATGFQDQPAMRGIVDEITVTARAVPPRRLDSPLTESGNQFFIRESATLTPLGPFVNAQPQQWPQFGNQGLFPQDGGLLWIDGEVVAYQTFDPVSDQFTVAANGRGLLGTTARGHDVGATCFFLEQIPCEVLAAPLRERDPEIALNRLGGFPRHGGTVILDTEIAHYCWTTNDGTLGMPGFFDPQQPDLRAEGLFRGRFGTNPRSLPAGSPVISFPFRYWDRHRDRADDPESSYVQFTHDGGPGYVFAFDWAEEGQSVLVDMQCMFRVDGRGDFTDDPARRKGLYLFQDGVSGAGTPHFLNEYGSRTEARFFVEYGAGSFDPLQFRAHDWKFAPTLRRFSVSYESEGRILSERITAR